MQMLNMLQQQQHQPGMLLGNIQQQMGYGSHNSKRPGGHHAMCQLGTLQACPGQRSCQTVQQGLV
jgi:hypothetical protein